MERPSWLPILTGCGRITDSRGDVRSAWTARSASVKRLEHSSPLWTFGQNADSRSVSLDAPSVSQYNEEPGLDVLVSRQPVVDCDMRTIGYRVSYAVDAEDLVVAHHRSEIRLFGDFLSVVGLEELVGSTVAHLPVSGELLRTLGIPPVRPDRVLLRLSYHAAVDSELQPIIDGLAMRGYALSVYDLPGPEFDVSVLERFGTVEIDVPGWSDDD